MRLIALMGTIAVLTVFVPPTNGENETDKTTGLYVSVQCFGTQVGMDGKRKDLAFVPGKSVDLVIYIGPVRRLFHENGADENSKRIGGDFACKKVLRDAAPILEMRYEFESVDGRPLVIQRRATYSQEHG